MKKTLLRKGFTLVELLVVIAIIGILTAIITANFAGAKAKSRDAKRVSDLAQLQLALEQQFDKCEAYPPSPLSTASVPTGCAYPLSTFTSTIPTDYGIPYTYAVSGTNADYVLRAKLEQYNQNVLTDSLGGTVLGQDCTHPSSGPYYYCVQPR